MNNTFKKDQEIKTIIIDPEEEYKNIIKKLNLKDKVKIINIDPTKFTCLNPFTIDNE